MAKRCTRCGNFLMDDERFCTRCGENVADLSPESSVPTSGSAMNDAGMGAAGMNAGPDNSFGRNTGYVSPTNTYQQPYGQPVNSTYKPYNSYNEEMSLGKWVLTLIVTTFFGPVSLVFLFVWGFGDGPESRKRYCKAMLIVMLISIAVAIIFSMILFGILGSLMSQQFQNYIQRSNEIRNRVLEAAVFFSSFAG